MQGRLQQLQQAEQEESKAARAQQQQLQRVQQQLTDLEKQLEFLRPAVQDRPLQTGSWLGMDGAVMFDGEKKIS